MVFVHPDCFKRFLADLAAKGCRVFAPPWPLGLPEHEYDHVDDYLNAFRPAEDPTWRLLVEILDSLRQIERMLGAELDPLGHRFPR